MPFISVVIPVHNRAHTVLNALESVIAQDITVGEIIVVDDASTDGLDKVLAPYRDRITVIRHPENQGAGAARNTGIEAATGDYVAFLDSDDSWSTNKLTRQMRFMTARGFAVSCTNFYLQSEVPEPDATSAAPPTEDGLRDASRPYGERLTRTDLSWGCFVSPGSTLVCRRDILLSVAGYDTAFERYEDWDLLLRIADHVDAGIGFLPEALAIVDEGVHAHVDKAFAGLNQMSQKHTKNGGSHRPVRAGSNAAGRGIRAGIAFNEASLRWAAGDRLGCLRALLHSIALRPFNHWALRNIALPRLRRLIKI